jgi:hypothetical protein|nr:MAG TPA: Dna polymerase B [Caudoviricetes sp.]
MAIFRTHKNQNYTVMSNYHLKEKNMSLKAKGLLSVMLSLPDDWDYSLAGLVAICKENETSVKSAIKELKDFGYIRIDKLMPNETESGRIEYVYNVFEQPQDISKQGNKKQALENQPLENQPIENQVQLNTKKQNTKELNTKKIKNKKNSKKDAKIEYITRKGLEYDLDENVIDLVCTFFSGLIDNGRLVTNEKINATLSVLAKYNQTTQINAIQLSLDRGYVNINPAWLKGENTRNSSSYRVSINEQESQVEQNFEF